MGDRPPQIATLVEQAHQCAVADTMRWLEDHATFTRRGHGGIRQVETRGLVAVAFTHRDSRAGDPDLHTHVAVSNKVQAADDGAWLALDGRVVHKAITAASERYNTRLEAHLTARLGVRFTERAGCDPAKRPVREITGIDVRLTDFWSSRRAAIQSRQGRLATTFQAEHGRPPTAWEAIELAQQAILETRQAKHAPRTEAEQRWAWWQEAVAVLGEPDLQLMTGHLEQVIATPRPEPAAMLVRTRIRELAGEIVATVSAHRATWQVWHVRAEAERQARAHNLSLDVLDATVEHLVNAALGEHSIPLADPDGVVPPPALRRTDGTSVYRVAGAEVFTSTAILAAETRLLDASTRHDGRVLDAATIELALLAATANGVELTDGQVALVRAMAGSGARLQLALAPAGTGKTTALRVLTDAWRDGGGTALGLAPSAAAAAVLGKAIGVRTDTLAKLVHDLTNASAGPTLLDRIGPASLVLIDEAGMAATGDLDRIVAHVLDRGGSVRLIGDDRQLAAIGAGGILRDIAAHTGAVTLNVPVRFTDPTEAAATIAVRDGDPTGLGFYLQHHRIHVGDPTTAAGSAYTAWAADRAAGLDSVLLAGTRDTVTALNERARTDRLTTTRVTREVRLRDGTSASAGDVIITRTNNRRLPLGSHDWVKNGDRWTVRQVHPDGALAVTPLTGTGAGGGSTRQITLPPDYVAHDVVLGYASTIHSAQGATADTSHTVLDGHETRQQLYVALTRGRYGNDVHVALPATGAEHSAISRDSLIPPGATELLTRILATDGAQHSATSQLRDLASTQQQLHDAVTRYRDAITVAGTPHPHPGPPGTRPLPWLPPIPTHLAADDQWRPYLNACARQVSDLAERLTDNAADSRAPWASQLARIDANLPGAIATWQAAHGHPARSTALTQPSDPSADEQRYLTYLRGRVATVVTQLTPTNRWHDLVAEIHPDLVTDPAWPMLAGFISRADRAGYNVDTQLPDLLNARPLDPAHVVNEALFRLIKACPAAMATLNENARHYEPDPAYRPQPEPPHLHPPTHHPGISI